MRTRGVSLPAGQGVWGEGHMVTADDARLPNMSSVSSNCTVEVVVEWGIR